MTIPSDPAPAPDPAGIPADPTAYRRRGPGLGVWAWAVSAVLCVALGVVAAQAWQRLFQDRTPAAPTTAATAASAPPAPATDAVALAPVAETGDGGGGGDSVLAERLSRVEAAQRRTLSAAGAALAASSLIQASQTSSPFAGELNAVEALLPDMTPSSSLRRAAIYGVPTRAVLAAEYPDAAARAVAASRAPAEGAGVIARIMAGLSKIFTVRRVSNRKGNGPDAVLARAEDRVNLGDIEGALRELDRLPPAGRDAIAPWRQRAEQRVDVDRRVATIRADAMRALTQSMGTP